MRNIYSHTHTHTIPPLPTPPRRPFPPQGEWKKGDYSTDKDFKRGFVGMILDPIYQFFDSIIQDKKDKYEKMLTSLNIVLKTEERELTGKALLKRVMQKWLPAGDAVLEMVVLHLPSPRDAQKYRTDALYEGPLDGECGLTTTHNRQALASSSSSFAAAANRGVVGVLPACPPAALAFNICFPSSPSPPQTPSRWPCATATPPAPS